MPKDTAGSAVWTIGKLVQAVKQDSSTTVRIEIPKFQRHLVWNQQQKVELIDSIHKGYPIGAILLFKRPNPTGGHELYQVVDGLQRTSTLVGYSEEPLVYASSNLFPESAISLLATQLGKDPAHVRRAVEDWMRETKRLKFSAGFSPNKLADRLQDVLDVRVAGSHVNEFMDGIASALDSLQTSVDVSSVTLPVVTYSGSEGELPEIFERINQSGTGLNKYEVFAATWITNSETLVTSESVRVAVNEKYATLISRGFAISGLESDRAIQDFNLFEYLFGLGKCLVRGHSLMFSEKSDPAETEPAAFSLSCVIRGHQLARMSKLPDFMPRAEDGVIDPSTMESAILTAATAVQNWLSPFIGLRLNNTGDGIDIAHGELQMVSMIARAIAGRWDSRGGWSERPDWQSDWTALKAAMPQHYLMDLVEETWRGPIYSTLFARVWDVGDDGQIVAPSNHYARPIDRKTWDNSLDTWFGKQLVREQRSRPYVRSVDRLFLRFVYTGLVSHKDDKGQQFELEHLFPVSRLKEVIAASDGPGWPISCIANLALFTKSLNREKSKLTISEFLSGHSLKAADQAVLDKLLLTPSTEVSIPLSGFSRENYLDFLHARWLAMKTELFRTLDVQEQ
jgi:hypothetical protein